MVFREYSINKGASLLTPPFKTLFFRAVNIHSKLISMLIFLMRCWFFSYRLTRLRMTRYPFTNGAQFFFKWVPPSLQFYEAKFTRHISSVLHRGWDSSSSQLFFSLQIAFIIKQKHRRQKDVQFSGWCFISLHCCIKGVLLFHKNWGFLFRGQSKTAERGEAGYLLIG